MEHVFFLYYHSRHLWPENPLCGILCIFMSLRRSFWSMLLYLILKRIKNGPVVLLVVIIDLLLGVVKISEKNWRLIKWQCSFVNTEKSVKGFKETFSIEEKNLRLLDCSVYYSIPHTSLPLDDQTGFQSNFTRRPMYVYCRSRTHLRWRPKSEHFYANNFTREEVHQSSTEKGTMQRNWIVSPSDGYPVRTETTFTGSCGWLSGKDYWRLSVWNNNIAIISWFGYLCYLSMALFAYWKPNFHCMFTYGPRARVFDLCLTQVITFNLELDGTI